MKPQIYRVGGLNHFIADSDLRLLGLCLLFSEMGVVKEKANNFYMNDISFLLQTESTTGDPQITPFCSMSFSYNVDEMPWELNSCLYRLACGKTGFVVCCLA